MSTDDNLLIVSSNSVMIILVKTVGQAVTQCFFHLLFTSYIVITKIHVTYETSKSSFFINNEDPTTRIAS